MTKQKKPVLGGRYNEKTGELEFYEMTDAEVEEATNSLGRILETLPVPVSPTAEMFEAEAARGAASARQLLARKPSQAEIQENYELSIYEERLIDTPLNSAFDQAYCAVLRPHLI